MAAKAAAGKAGKLFKDPEEGPVLCSKMVEGTKDA